MFNKNMQTDKYFPFSQTNFYSVQKYFTNICKQTNVFIVHKQMFTVFKNVLEMLINFHKREQTNVHECLKMVSEKCFQANCLYLDGRLISSAEREVCEDFGSSA